MLLLMTAADAASMSPSLKESLEKQGGVSPGSGH